MAQLHRVRALQRLVVRHVELPIGLGRRFVLASDLHADDRFMPRRLVRALVDAINAVERTDAVLLPGDFTASRQAPLTWLGEELGRIEAPAFASLGNHDLVFDDGEAVARMCERAAMPLLVNRSVELAPGVWVGGLDSAVYGKPDVHEMLAPVPDGAACVVLGHEPWSATLHEQALHVAGHTHHGQIRLPGPWRYLPYRSQPYVEGLYEVPLRRPSVGARDRRWVYTTAGVGSTTVPLRVGCPPEIVVLDV